MFDRAADRFTVAVVGKKSAGRSIMRLFDVIDALTGGHGNVTPPQDEILIKDRETGNVIYSETIDEGPRVAEFVQAFEHDLGWLMLEALCEKYGIGGYPPA